jgi:hypothetical protein
MRCQPFFVVFFLFTNRFIPAAEKAVSYLKKDAKTSLQIY